MKYDNVEWKVKKCDQGKKCWCRMISSINGDEVIDAGFINKKMAKYIVRLHNYHLENRKMSNELFTKEQVILAKEIQFLCNKLNKKAKEFSMLPNKKGTLGSIFSGFRTFEGRVVFSAHIREYLIDEDFFSVEDKEEISISIIPEKK